MFKSKEIRKLALGILLSAVLGLSVEPGKSQTEKLQNKEAKVASLLQDLDSENRLTKARAIEDLGDLKVKEAVPKIIDSLQHEEWIVKAQACVALGKIKDERAVKPLIKVLENEQENWSIRLKAAKSLAQISSPAAFEPLIKALKYESELVRKKLDPPIRKERVDSEDDVLEREYFNIVFDICLQDKKNYIPRLKKYLNLAEKGSKFRFYMAEMLGRLNVKEKEIISILIEYLEKSPNGWIRLYAANILGELGNKDAIEPLIKALKDDFLVFSNYVNEEVGKAQMKQIKDFGGKDIIGSLVFKKCKDDYGVYYEVYCYVVRDVAASSLKKLGVKVERYDGTKYRVVK